MQNDDADHWVWWLRVHWPECSAEDVIHVKVCSDCARKTEDHIKATGQTIVWAMPYAILTQRTLKQMFLKPGGPYEVCAESDRAKKLFQQFAQEAAEEAAAAQPGVTLSN